MSRDERAAVREDVIETIERSVEVYGLSRSAGRVYGVLLFAEEPLTIAQLVDRSGYAKSTISNVTRKLTRIGMLHRRSSEGGGRRVRFAPETDLWFVIQDVYTQYVAREMDLSQRSFDRARDRLEALDDEADGDDLERVEELAQTYGRLQTLLELAMNHSPEELIEAVRSREE